jgi:hypothetical protein
MMATRIAARAFIVVMNNDQEVCLPERQSYITDSLRRNSPVMIA